MEKLQEIRKKNNYSLNYMASKLNISKPFYWQLENKKRRLSYDMAVKISEIFNLKPDDIFYENKKED